MTARQQYRLAKVAGWGKALEAMVQRRIVSYQVYDALRRDRVHEYLTMQRCYHWSPVITESRMACANFREVGNGNWQHRNPAIQDRT